MSDPETSPSSDPTPIGKAFATSVKAMVENDFVSVPPSLADPVARRRDIDAFVERMLELTGETRHGVSRSGKQAPLRQKAHAFRDEPPKVDLVLYVSPESEKCRKALRAVKEVLSEYVTSQVKFSTCDLSKRPQDGEVDAVVFTPMLVKQGAGPKTAIIGNLDDHSILKDLLDTSGVERRQCDD